MRVEADLHLGRGDPARELDERVRVVELDCRLLAQLADRRRAVSAVAVTLLSVDGASWEHPHTAHEASLGRAPDEQDLEALVLATQQDHGRRLARRARRARVVL